MAKRVAIEWDTRELRIVAGTLRGTTVTFNEAISVPIESDDPKAVGEKLREVLAAHGLEKSSAAIALGRGKAELRELKLPPVPDEELPEVVRFQAVRTFAGAGERAIIDYLPTRRDADGIRVIAAAVSPEELKRCALVGVPAQLSVDHVVLAPLAAAALYRRSDQGQAGETVLIDLTAEDADIVVLRDGTPVFVRSIRLPDEPAVRIRTLTGEVRRSLMACQEAEGAVSTERRVILWGREEVHREEVQALSESLGRKVTTLDPFSMVAIGSSLQGRLPEHAGRLAPLVGLLDSDARHGDDLIDFLNPRKAPEPVNQRGRQLVAAAAVLAILGFVAFLGWRRLDALDDDIASQEAALASLADDVEAADEAIARTAKVEAFLDGNVVWLDELRRLAVNMPPAETTIIDSMTARAARDGGGTLVISGGVSDSTTVGELETALRDEHHRVVGKGLGRVANNAPYNWEFSETIEVDPTLVQESRAQAIAQRMSGTASESVEPPASPPGEASPPTKPSTAADAEDSAEPPDSDNVPNSELDSPTGESAAAEPSSTEATPSATPASGEAPAEMKSPTEGAEPAEDVEETEAQPVTLGADEISENTTSNGAGSEAVSDAESSGDSTMTASEKVQPEDVQ